MLVVLWGEVKNILIPPCIRRRVPRIRNPAYTIQVSNQSFRYVRDKVIFKYNT